MSIDQPAHGARQVVMVLPAERLAQLEAIVVADSGHALQDADASRVRRGCGTASSARRRSRPRRGDPARTPGDRPWRRGRESPGAASCDVARRGRDGARRQRGDRRDRRCRSVSALGRHAVTVPSGGSETGHGGVQLGTRGATSAAPMNRFLAHLDYLQRRHRGWHCRSRCSSASASMAADGSPRRSRTGRSSASSPCCWRSSRCSTSSSRTTRTRARTSSTGQSARCRCSAPNWPTRRSALGGSWTTVAIGLLVALWAGLAAANALQTALEEIWDTPGVRAPQRRRACGCARSAFLVIFAVGISVVDAGIDVGALRRPRPARRRRPASSSRSSSTRRCCWPPSGCSSAVPTVSRAASRRVVAAAAIVALQAVGTFIVQPLHRRCERHLRHVRRRHRPAQLVLPRVARRAPRSRAQRRPATTSVSPRSLVGSTAVTEGDRRAVLLDARRVQRDPRIGVAVSVEGDEADGLGP